VILRHVKYHYVIYGDGDSSYGPITPKRLSPGAKRFWNRYGLGDAEEAVVAYENGRLVGFFRFSVGERFRLRTDPAAIMRLVAGGTWVDTSARRQGLGKRMWKYAIERTKPDEIDVSVVSRGGGSLVQSLQREYRTLRWDTY